MYDLFLEFFLRTTSVGRSFRKVVLGTFLFSLLMFVHAYLIFKFSYIVFSVLGNTIPSFLTLQGSFLAHHLRYTLSQVSQLGIHEY